MTTVDAEREEMTPEERLAWLRERGIQVSTPEERKVAEAADSIRYAESYQYPREAFSYVLVPADTSKPLQQLTCSPTSNKPGDFLVDHLKPSFAGNGRAVDVNLLQQQASQTLTGADTPNVSEDSLAQVAGQASVETFTVVHGTPSNKFTEVLIYLDEVGMLKRLKLNTRASMYAQAAGFDPPPQLYGDVYMGRVERKPVLCNVDFKLGVDTALDAPWLQAATMENLNHQVEVNRITGHSAVEQPKVDGDGKPKEECGFSWTQTEEEVEISLPLQQEVKSNTIKVVFRPKAVRVTIPSVETLNFALFEQVDVDGCTWTIDSEPSRKLVLSMEKMEHALWPRIKD